MLTAHFVEEKAMDIELPNSENATKVDNDERITIAIDKESVIYFCGKRTKKERLLGQLKHRFETDKKREIFIQGDKNTHLQLLLEIMDIGKKADAKAISIETRDNG
jgi:biopolymer transport protein ExbD